jgi:murein DD-endopeptidase MepM/ murein hydrolase activator NlpD
MAISEESIRLLIEADDRTQKTFDEAKKRVEDLVRTQSEANAKITAAQTQLANGQTKVNMKASEYLALVKQADNAAKSLTQATKEYDKALAQLEKSHTRLAHAQQQFANQSTTAYQRAGEAVSSYISRFIGIAAVIDLMRRALDESAKLQRGMTQLQFESRATGEELGHLGERFDKLSAITGRTAIQTAAEFRKFRDEIGSSGKEVEDAFEAITIAAETSGNSFEALSKSAVTAIKQLNVPMSEIKGMLDVWVEAIPASMMETWNTAATGIIGAMRDVGFTSSDAAKKAAQDFGALSGALGSADRAASLMTAALHAATDVGSLVGLTLIPKIQELNKGTEGSVAINKLLYDEYVRLDVYSDDILTRQRAREQFRKGMSDQQLRDLEDAVKLEQKIQEEVERTGDTRDVVEKRHMTLQQQQQAAINQLTAAYRTLLATIGETFGTSAISTFAENLKGLRTEIQWYIDKFNYLKSLVPSGAASPVSPQPEAIRGGGRGEARRRREAAGTRTLGPNIIIPGQRPRPEGPATFQERFGEFQEGGAFTVGGRAGGGDSQDVGFRATPGERVAVTTALQESLQQQQDKADIASREHFARFHQTAFTRTTAAPWWPGSQVREAGVGGGSGSVAGGGGIPGGSQGGGGPTTRSPGAGGDDTDGKVAPASATSTAPAATIPATLPGSVASLGYEPGKFTPVQDLTTASGTSAGSEGGGGLAADRARYAKELAANPALREKIMRIAQNEQGGNANGTQAVIETLMNRASYQGISLEKAARWTGEGGYYAQGSMGRNMTAEQRATIEKSLDNVLKGGNVSNYGTDNASGNFAKRRIANDMYRQTNYINGEYFTSPGLNPAGPGKGNYDKYQAWLARMKAGDAAAPSAAKESAVKTAKLTPNTTPDLTGLTDPNVSKLPVSADPTISMPGGGPASPISGELWQGVGAHRSAYSNIGAHAHKGFDIGAKLGTPIHAEADGTVIKHEYQPGAVGGIVTIRYKDGTTAKYMHLSKWDMEGIKKDGPVKAGQVVGLAGASPGAKSAGVHLHVEYYDKNGKLVRPEDRHGWGKTNEKGEGLHGRVVFAGIRGSFPKGTTREAALKQSGTTDNKPATAPTNVKTVAVKPSTAEVDPSLLAPPTNKPAAAPTNTKVATDKPAAGQKHVHKAGEPDHEHPPRTTQSPGTRALLGATPTPAVKPEGQGGIGSRQWGGPVRAGQQYTVGESGPETFTPAGPGQITPGSMDLGGMAAQYRQFAEMVRAPIEPNIQMPRAGPIRQRMSRHVEAQRERDVTRMTRHASHSDIGFV